MRRSTRVCVAAAVLGLLVWCVPVADASTPRTTSGCKATTTPGAGINTYPAYGTWPGTQSAFSATCVFDARTPGSMVSDSYTIHDFGNLLWHNGAARTIQNTLAITA